MIYAVVHYPGKDAFMQWRGQTLDEVNAFLNGLGVPFEMITAEQYDQGISELA